MSTIQIVFTSSLKTEKNSLQIGVFTLHRLSYFDFFYSKSIERTRSLVLNTSPHYFEKKKKKNQTFGALEKKIYPKNVLNVEQLNAICGSGTKLKSGCDVSFRKESHVSRDGCLSTIFGVLLIFSFLEVSRVDYALS